jgi:wyosine [tRNA(Phe)-imidazoG37] synthetase (radical SAM superfamily)
VGRVLDFRDHRRELGDNRYVYAVVSRRAGGLSVGINLNPDKRCNFACRYCQVDRSTPRVKFGVDVDRLMIELDTLLSRVRSGSLWRSAPFDTALASLRRLADIAFAGDGEPTLAAELPEAAGRVRQLCDSLGLDVPLRLLSNAARFDRRAVRSALSHFDELWCKLDAGSEAYFGFVAASRIGFSRVLDNLLSVARERPIVLQSLFFSCRGVGPSADEIQAYLERLDTIRAGGGRIARVQVYTVARPPADPAVGPLALPALVAIATRVAAGGFKVEAYGGHDLAVTT